MTMQLNEENGGKVLVLHVSGKLVKEDCEHFVPEFERLVLQHGKLRLLFDMTGFHGWEASAAWEDFKFGIEHFADIERLAMVGEKQWQGGMGVAGRSHYTRDVSITTTISKRKISAASQSHGIRIWKW